MDDKIYILDIDSTSSDVSGNQHIECTSAEGRKSSITLFLSNISMNGLCSQCLKHASGYQLITFCLSFSKYDCFSKNLLLQGRIGFRLGGSGGGGNGIVLLIIFIIFLVSSNCFNNLLTS